MAGLTEGGGPEGQDDQEVTPPPLMKELIEGHLSALTSIIKVHNRKNKIDPIKLDFDEDDTTKKDTHIAKGKEVVDDNLRKPFKEALKTPLTCRIIEFAGPKYKIQNNIKLYQRTTDPKDHLGLFANAANFDEWPMPVWCKKFQQTLDGPGRGWFERLSANSIDEWVNLREAFTTKYSVSKACFKEPHEITRKKTQWKSCLNTTLKTLVCEGLCRRTIMKFTIIMVPSPYNVILGRTGLRALRAIPSTIYSMMKFPTLRGIATLVTRSVIVSECRRLEKKQVIEEEKKEEVKTKVVNMTKKILVNPAFPYQLVVIGGGLLETCKRIIEHKLNVDTSIEPERQKRRVLAPKNSEVVTRDVGEWVKASIRLIDSTFQSQIERNLEAYVDDMVIKSNDENMLMADMVETFDNLRKINMKLNPKKCSFGVEEGKFLGYMAYLVISKEAVSSILLTDRKGKQSPIQYVSRTLNAAKINYAPMEKLALSLVYMTRRLMRYFEAQPVKVITDQPIKQILNFITETPNGESPEKYFRTPKVTPERDETEEWMLFTDEASSSKGSRAGLVLICTCGVEHTYALRLTFDSTNNEAEYEACLTRLRIARRMNIQKLEVKVDSKLVTNQINGKYLASYDNMMKYLEKAKEYIACLNSFSIKNIPRNENQKAGVLSKLASVAFNHLTKEVLVEILNERSIEVKEMNTVVVHPQANRLVKRANKSLMEGIKTRLGREKVGWVDELPNVLWAHRTSIKTRNEETPFSLTYGSEAVIPAEIGMPTYKTMMIREGLNEKKICLNLDLLIERKELATIREAKYKTKLERYYNRKVHLTSFKPGEFVFQKNKASGWKIKGS
uniref:Uncharacterized protein n=1 Tax=Tanacetum cinerariifolium TaxID=118510 RepID=A0A6L2ML73_TANCI|nr:hypothetical protein [Tanacetum cinerariifolium]